MSDLQLDGLLISSSTNDCGFEMDGGRDIQLEIDNDVSILMWPTNIIP